MNLKEIREEINSALDYNPELKQYTDNIARIVNRHYLQISSQYQWLFMQKREMITLRADIKGSATDTLTADGSQFVTLPTTTGAGIKNLPPDILGKTLVIDNIEYRITAYVNARSFVVDQIVPDGTYTDWTIEFRKYPLPRDCIEVLGAMDRGHKTTETLSFVGQLATDTSTQTITGPDRGRFVFLDARKEEYLYLDRSDTGDPFVSVEEIHDNVEPPDYPLLLEVETRSSTTPAKKFPSGDKYTIEYCYTFTYAGMESPPSLVSSIDIEKDTSSRNFQIKLTNFMDTSAVRLNTRDGTGETNFGFTGRLKKLYRRIIFEDKNSQYNARSSGANEWRHIATIGEKELDLIDQGQELITSTVDVSGGASSKGETSPTGEVFSLDRLNETGPRQYLRFWYTPQQDYMIEIRYHKRPFRLRKDSDQPQWPVQFHHYLVYAALRDICMQHGMLNHSQLYERRAGDFLKAMRAKYLTRTDRLHIRRGFDRSMSDRERFGIPSKS